MKAFLIPFFLGVLVASYTAFGGSGSLPRAKLPVPASTGPKGEASAASTATGGVASGTQIKPGSCHSLFGSALGSKGFITEDGKFYYQLYTLESKGNVFRQVFEEIDLRTFKQKDLLAFNLPLVDIVSYESRAEGEGVSFVTFDSNQDNCYSGPATMISIPIKRDLVSDKTEIKKEQGKVSSLIDLNYIWNFYDLAAKSLFEMSYNPFLKRRLSFPVQQNQRIVFIGQGKIKRPFITLKDRDPKDQKSAPTLTNYDMNANEVGQIKLRENEKVLFERLGNVGTLVLEKKGLAFEVNEFKSWGSGNRDQVFKASFPVGFLPSQSNFLVNFQKRVIVGYPVSSFFKSRWPSVLILDYETGKELGRISFKDGVVGQVSMNHDGTRIVAEEIDGTSLVRKSLVVYDIASKKATFIGKSVGSSSKPR